MTERNQGYAIDSRLDTGTLVTETLLVEHVVGLVKHQDSELSRIHNPPLNHILYSAGGAHHNRAGHSRGASGTIRRNSCTNHQTVEELTHDLDDTNDLTGQLTSRGKNQGLRSLLKLLGTKVETAEDIEDEGGGLASTGLRLANEVLRRVAHEQRQGAFLNLGRLAEAHVRETLGDALIAV